MPLDLLGNSIEGFLIFIDVIIFSVKGRATNGFLSKRRTKKVASSIRGQVVGLRHEGRGFSY